MMKKKGRRVSGICAMVLAASMVMGSTVTATADFGDLAMDVYGIPLTDLDAGGTLHGQYEGEKLVIATKQGEMENGLKAVAPYFEAVSGAEVEVNAYPEANYMDKIQMDLSSGHTYDAILMPIAFTHSFAESGFLQEIGQYTEDSSIVSPNFDEEDFIQSLLEQHGMYKGTFYSLPFKPDIQMMFYRKDLFEDEAIKAQYKEKTGNDLKVPETMEELYEVAAFFTKSLNPDSPVEYGFNLMGAMSMARWTYWNRLASFGGVDIDANFRPGFNNEAGVEAFNSYLKLAEFCTPEWIQFDFDTANNFFIQGEVAMMEQWPGLAQMAESEGSKIPGKVGYAVVAGGTPCTGGWSLSVSKGSSNPELAYKFIEYATSKDMDLVKIATGNYPCRVSTYAYDEVLEANPIYSTLADSMAQGEILADYDVPFVSSKLNDITEIGVNSVLLGNATPEEALATMEAEILAEIEAIGLLE